MAAGTAAALVPIKSITLKSKNDKFTYHDESDEPGPVCRKLLSTLKGIQQGKIEDSFGWLSQVREESLEVGKAGARGEGKDEANGMVDKLP